MDTLTAYKIPVSARILETFLDHTYVESSKGHQWGCFGASTGGRPTVEGVGDSDISQCIAPNNTGLKYGITGVCHQATNRLLSPSNVTLDGNVRGYFLSYATYNEYGLDINEWHERQAKCSVGNHTINDYPLLNALLLQKSILASGQSSFQIDPSFQLSKKHNAGVTSLTKRWKNSFLDHAIDYVRSNTSLQYYVNEVNSGANAYVHCIARNIGYGNCALLLGQDINPATKLKLLEIDKFES
ncbi:hypothetical protein LFR94_004574 [Vibrio vulnificus]|uniref:hypothetical protein n=1 Tax=Vibrio vulnificus TaxID=672 RepID=UPI001D46F8D2|nr:hypothetical protein [Vibrio vulnificus]EIV8646761.1 hypothetical protein [Vibrio parahaemolyticus]EGQ9240283.1 hypothetical protein [Vibrio vulnificus]EGR7962013.1 hypothetical protein [Vibrio vulnificus]EGR7986987.1 hypothetical protein [Vibrio vulnificus]